MISKNGIDVYQGNNPDGSLDVNVQDQTTQALDLYFTQVKGSPTTLTADVDIDDNIISVTSADDMLVGDYIGIFSGGVGRYYFGEIVAINTLDITLDTPLDYAYTSAAATVISNTRDMNVSGTQGSPQIFTITNGGSGSPPIDLNRFLLSMDCGSSPEWTDFGDISDGITNGLVLRYHDGSTKNIWNIKSNSDLALVSYDMTLRLAVGNSGVSSRFTFNGADKHGVTLRLHGGDSLQLIIQDNLSTITKFTAMAQGHNTIGEE